MARSGSGCLADALTVERPAAEVSSTSPDLSATEPKHRSSVPIKKNQRLYLELPVLVYSLSTGKKLERLLEVARSLVVYPGGGVLSLGATVKLGQELLLINPQNKVQATCRVAGFEPKKNGPQPLVRLEFTQRVSRFWGVAFPPEKGDPAERKLPRLPRHSRRVESFQPIQVRQAEQTGSEATDMCITQNISRNGLYFTSGELSYREGMRLTISFLRHSDLFALNTSHTAQIVRVDRIEDGYVGVAVRLVGNNNVRPPAAPTPSRSDVSFKGIGHGLAVVPGHLCRSLRDTGIRIVRWPVPHFARIRQSAAKQANALVCLGTTLAKLCKNRIEAWRKSTAGLVRSACLASAARAISLGRSAGVQFVKLSCEARGHLEKHLCYLAAALIRVKSLELWPSVPRPRAWLKGIAKPLLLAVAPIRTAFTLPKGTGPHEL
jgi:hypothetical protein